MTVPQALTHAACILASSAITAGVAYVLWQRWADEHHYRRVRLEATRVRALYDTADHEHRLRLHEQKRADRNEAVAHAYARLAAAATRPRHLARRRRSYRGFLAAYGAGRAA